MGPDGLDDGFEHLRIERGGDGLELRGRSRSRRRFLNPRASVHEFPYVATRLSSVVSKMCAENNSAYERTEVHIEAPVTVVQRHASAHEERAQKRLEHEAARGVPLSGRLAPFVERGAGLEPSADIAARPDDVRKAQDLIQKTADANDVVVPRDLAVVEGSEPKKPAEEELVVTRLVPEGRARGSNVKDAVSFVEPVERRETCFDLRIVLGTDEFLPEEYGVRCVSVVSEGNAGEDAPSRDNGARLSIGRPPDGCGGVSTLGLGERRLADAEPGPQVGNIVPESELASRAEWLVSRRCKTLASGAQRCI